MQGQLLDLSCFVRSVSQQRFS